MKCLSEHARNTQTHMHACTHAHTHMHTHTHTRTHTYACTHTRTHTHNSFFYCYNVGSFRFIIDSELLWDHNRKDFPLLNTNHVGSSELTYSEYIVLICCYLIHVLTLRAMTSSELIYRVLFNCIY
jgi:hypothetical protein